MPSHEDIQSTEEISMQLKTSSSFLDSKVILDLSFSKNRAWFQTMGPRSAIDKLNDSLNFYKHYNDDFLSRSIFLTIELASYVFNLPMEGDISCDMATLKALEKVLGIP